MTTAMQIDPQDTKMAPKDSSSPAQSLDKKAVTMKDSMDVISELISEIQASDKLNLDIPVPDTVEEPSPSPATKQCIWFSLARQKRTASSAMSLLPSLHKFFQVLLGTHVVQILPIRNDSQASPLQHLHQVNELAVVGAKVIFKASKPNSASLAGDFHVSTTLMFDQLCSQEAVMNWLTLQGYYVVLCECQTSDMIKIGFLSQVHPYLWCTDLCDMIKDMDHYQDGPFQFWLFPGSLSCSKKGTSAPVLMVEVEWEHVLTGLDFLCKSFDGENPLSPCGIPYPFFTLYQNQLSDMEGFKIIQDINLDIGDVDIVHLYGFTDIKTMITLKQSVKIKLCKLLLAYVQIKPITTFSCK